MKERLVIRNFGPIKSVDLELGKMTILIGGQATGKSTIAKVLAICRYFSYIINYSINVENLNQFHANDQFFDGLKDWGIDDFLSEDSYIVYENSSYKIEVESKLIVEYERISDFGEDYKKEYFQIYTKIKPISDSFKELLEQLDELKLDESLKKKTSIEFFQMLGWTPNENFYRLNVKKVMDNPLYLPTERSLQSVSAGNNHLISNALQDELVKLNRITRGYKRDVVIEPLALNYKNLDGLGYVKKYGEENFYTLHNGASGFQSTIPIVLAMKFYNEIDKRERTFILEEPELNLFPSAQKKLMEYLVESANKYDRNRFLLPTHSPYILSSLNNMIYAYTLGNYDSGRFKKRVCEIIKEEFWINANDVSAYYLKDGIAVDIVNREESQITIDDLDYVSTIINKEFDQLLNVEVESEL